MKHVVSTILDVLQICDCPYITASVVARQLKPEIWAEDRKKAYTNAYGSLRSMTRSGSLKYDTDSNVFLLPGIGPPRGTDYLDHNEAVIAFVVNAYVNGYDVKYGGIKNADAIVNGKIAVELDRRNHTGNKALRNQVEKYEEKDEIEKVLYVSFPGKCKPAVVKFEKEPQLLKSKSLRKKIQSYRLNNKLKKKLLFATYVEATDPYADPLKEKVWFDIKGKNVDVI